MDANDRGGRFADGGAKHLAGMGEGGSRRARGDLDPFDKPVLPVETEYPEFFDFEPENDGLEISGDEFGAIKERGFAGLLAHHASGDFHDGDQLERLDPADPFQFLEIVGPPAFPKLGFDAHAGWFAYQMPNDLAFVKRYATYPDRVYNEVAGLTISIWYPKAEQVPAVELEPIGPRSTLAPGESAAFTEHWWLLENPFPRAGAALDLPKLAAKVATETK